MNKNPSSNNRSVLFSDCVLSSLERVLRKQYPEVEMTGQELVETAIKITQFVAIRELEKGIINE